MAKITFITKDNKSITLEGQSGSLMELAVDNNIDGIDGDCGGVCSCATCHVHIAPEYTKMVGETPEEEKYILEFEDHFNQNSRLSCQLEISDKLDGLVLKVATS